MANETLKLDLPTVTLPADLRAKLEALDPTLEKAAKQIEVLKRAGIPMNGLVADFERLKDLRKGLLENF